MMKNLTIAAIFALGLLGSACAEDAKLKPADKAPAAATPSTSGYTNVKVPEFEKLRKTPGTVVLDVRTKAEFDKGHIPGAINLDVRADDFAQEAAKLDKSKTYLVHCAAGVRSVKACTKLTGLKFEKLYNLEGGYGEWSQSAGR
jgi:rhodanese-related sulfurtransferase